jgi:hypothetical protein
VAWSVVVKSGLRDVVMPNMVRYQGGATVVLSDQEIGQLSPTAFVTVLNSVAPLLITATWPSGGL